MEEMKDRIEASSSDTLSDVDLIIENRLNAHTEAVLMTINVKLDKVLEVHARLDGLIAAAEALAEEMKNSPIMGALAGGSFPGFGSFGG